MAGYRYGHGHYDEISIGPPLSQETLIEDDVQALKDEIASLKEALQKDREAEIEYALQHFDYVLSFDPGPSCCCECGEEIYTGFNGSVYKDRRNGGTEWITYCTACDFETFSLTFRDEIEDN